METHHALLVPEILNLIFQEIKHDKAALVSAALTCRSLLSIAMDFLWKELETSTPIKRLLPNLWNADGTYRTTVHRDEWKRFDEYAVRVEILGIDELDTRERYLWQLYCQVCNLRPGILPFPNLRKLRLYQDYEQADRAASLLLFPPSLRELRIDFGSSKFNGPLRIAEGYLQAAAQQVPRLGHLSLHGDPSATSYMCITLFERLHVLDLRHSRTVDAQVYRDLISAASTMRELVEFHLPDQRMNGIKEDCIPSCKGFQTLQVLGVHASPKNVVQFLDILDTPGLRAVICNGGNIQATFSGWRECVQKLCACHKTSLRSVELRSHGLNVWDINAGSVHHTFKDITMSLLKLHQLESVTLDLFMVILSPEDLDAMASAWPNLRYLRIKSKIGRYSHAVGGPSTYNCLVSLAQLCPNLVHLELFFRDDRLPDITEWPILSHRLENLILDVPLHIREQLAPFLGRIFPKKHVRWAR